MPKLARSIVSRRALVPVLAALLFAAAPIWPPASAAADPTVATAVLPEDERAFFDDGPGWLLPAADRAAWIAAEPDERARRIRDFLARDPLPETPANELEAGIAARRQAIRDGDLSFFDDRARLLFLHGAPATRVKVECSETFKPLELWRYAAAERPLVVYQPNGSSYFRLWMPTDSKRVLYTDEMEYYLEQWEELRGRLNARRIDLQACKSTETIDKATGVAGLFGFDKNRPTDEQMRTWLAPPSDLAAWTRAAAPSAAAAAPGRQMRVERVEAAFPEKRGDRIVTRLRLVLAPDPPVEVAVDGDNREVHLSVAGVVEAQGALFERFQVRYVLPPLVAGRQVALELERAFRPQGTFLVRLQVRDEVGGAKSWVTRVVQVPAAPDARPVSPLVDAIVGQGQEIGLTKMHDRDTLLLLPPADDVVFGLWRAEAIVAGDRIRKVVFLVNGAPQLSRSQPPWSAELRLPNLPTEMLVRVEGYDETGALVAADEVVLNEPQGEARIKLLSPPRGKPVVGRVTARAAVVVPQGRRVESVDFHWNDQLLGTLGKPPWEVTFDAPPISGPTYLTAAATYDDGLRVEDVRILSAGDFSSEIQVDLVELYTTVTDRSGRLVEGLTPEDFKVLDGGRPQKIERFELVKDLPLTLGLVLDTSGSMRESIGEAKRAASSFLRAVMTPKDRCLAVAFHDRPQLLMPLTPDASAVEVAFRDLPAMGDTALHDAIVYTLRLYRGIRGKKAIVLLSDGDDTSSLVPWSDTVKYARQSGVAIYTIGLGVPGTSLGIRRKLSDLADETGGRVFYISKADELSGVYGEIGRELRSQYLLAYSPDKPPAEGEFRPVEVQAQGGKLKARTMHGYTP
ncbi:MAG: VWA domain-containing protein [Thermoanaerobaculia bacterium]